MSGFKQRTFFAGALPFNDKQAVSGLVAKAAKNRPGRNPFVNTV